MEIGGSEESEDGNAVEIRMGFDTDAKAMHSDFLSELTHLSEVQESHYNVIREIESEVQRISVSPLDEFVSEFGAELSEYEISIPFKTTNISGISMETKDDDEGQLVRIIESERFFKKKELVNTIIVRWLDNFIRNDFR